MSDMTPTAEQRSDVVARVVDGLRLGELAPPVGPIRRDFAAFAKKFSLAARTDPITLTVTETLRAYGHADRAFEGTVPLLAVTPAWKVHFPPVERTLLSALSYARRAGDVDAERALLPVLDGYEPNAATLDGTSLKLPFEDEELLSQPVDMTSAIYGSAITDLRLLNVMWLYAKPKKLFGPKWHRARIEQQLETTVSQLHTLKGCQPGW